MAVTKRPISKSLLAFTTAALCLPGIKANAGMPVMNAQGNVEFGQYQEGNDRMQVQIYHADAIAPLSKRLELSFSIDRDTYSGASPAWSVPSSLLSQPLSKGGTADVISSASSITNQNLQDHITGFSAYQNAAGSITDKVAAVLNSAIPNGVTPVQSYQKQPLETRTQPVFGAKYYFDNSSLGLTGGMSNEPDYISNFAGVNYTQELNNKQTTLNFGYNIADNWISRNKSMSMSPPGVGLGMTMTDMCGQSAEVCKTTSNLNANSLYNAFNVGFSQVINKDTLYKASVDYTHQTGFLDNAYKTVYVRGLITAQDYVDKVFGASSINWNTLSPLDLVGVDLFREKRPNERNQFSISNGINHYVSALDASVHFDYRFYHDDWGIDSHTFDVSWYQKLPFGITATPNVRYYSQSSADFFAPYFLAPRADGHYSSDFRLAAFGAVNTGLTLNKKLGNAINLEAGVDYYMHQSDLTLGGGGSGAYADYNYYLAHAGLNVDLSATGSIFADIGDSSDEHAHHHHEHQNHYKSLPPAGVMFGHMMQKSNAVMVGYMYMNSQQSGAMLHGSQAVSDASLAYGSSVPISLQQYRNLNTGVTPQSVLTNQQLAGLDADACPGYAHAAGSIRNHNAVDYGCLVKPTSMVMGMHMFDIMYAPTDWLNLMLMPQLVDMTMSMSNDLRTPNGQGQTMNGLAGMNNVEMMNGTDKNSMYAGMNHNVFDLGDTIFMGLFKLYDDENHHVHIGLGGSAPTGSVSEVHYKVTSVTKSGDMMGASYPANITILQDIGMQAGSGTWDFKPNLTYTGQMHDAFWGAQYNSINRFQDHNKSGYALGDMFQASAWAGYSVFNWLSTTVRGVYTQQNRVRGDLYQINAATVLDGSNINQVGHDTVSTVNYPQNTGGHYWDIGLGVRLSPSQGILNGHTVSFEWLQPVSDVVNVYQLERTGTFSPTWTYMF